MASRHVRAAAVGMRSLFSCSCLPGGGSLATTSKAYACADWSLRPMPFSSSEMAKKRQLLP